ARRAADLGVAVLRFDFRGNGDSAGHSEDYSADSYLEDIHTAVAQLRRDCPKLESIDLLGMRFGATLASQYAVRHDGIRHLLLWEPIVSGEKYMQELLRINLSTQLAVYGKVRDNREQLVEKLATGEHANVDGYLISHGFYEQCGKIDLLASAACNLSGQTLVVQIAPNIKQKDRPEFVELAQQRPSSHFLKVEEPAFWREIKPYTSTTTTLIPETLSWLEQRNDS
ncbi:MAG: alpha/beta hydrolase, partial [Woeseia sp.]